MRWCQICGWWAYWDQEVRSPFVLVSGMIICMLLMIDLRVVRYGRPLDLGAGNQAVRAFWTGEV